MELPWLMTGQVELLSSSPKERTVWMMGQIRINEQQGLGIKSIEKAEAASPTLKSIEKILTGFTGEVLERRRRYHTYHLWALRDAADQGQNTRMEKTERF